MALSHLFNSGLYNHWASVDDSCLRFLAYATATQPDEIDTAGETRPDLVAADIRLIDMGKNIALAPGVA